MAMVNNDQLRSAAENPLALFISRYANIVTPFIVSGGLLLATWWINGKIDEKVNPVQATVNIVNTKVEAMQEAAVGAAQRLQNLESAKNVNDLTDQRQDFQIDGLKEKVASTTLKDMPPWTGQVAP
jgi:hypothetical protein